MTVTGERVTTPAGGFNPTWQRHVAAYAAAAEVLPPGRLLDVGAGVGHSFALLAPRETVGVDVDAGALAGQDRETVVADMRALPFPGASFDSVLAVQSIEHVPDAQRAVTEFARVLRDDGAAMLITPNRLTFGRPDEIIDPYHFVEYDAGQLRALCEAAFADVDVCGLFGSERYLRLAARDLERLDALLRRDPLRARRLVPRRVKAALYDRMLTRARADDDPDAVAIAPEDFTLRPDGLDAALDVVAICRGPKRDPARGAAVG